MGCFQSSEKKSKHKKNDKTANRNPNQSYYSMQSSQNQHNPNMYRYPPNYPHQQYSQYPPPNYQQYPPPRYNSGHINPSEYDQFLQQPIGGYNGSYPAQRPYSSRQSYPNHYEPSYYQNNGYKQPNPYKRQNSIQNPPPFDPNKPLEAKQITQHVLQMMGKPNQAQPKPSQSKKNISDENPQSSHSNRQLFQNMPPQNQQVSKVMVETGPSLNNDLKPHIKVTDSFMKNEIYDESKINIQFSQ